MASSTIILHLPRPVRRRLERRSAKTRDKVEFRRCQIVLQRAMGQKPEQIAGEPRVCRRHRLPHRPRLPPTGRSGARAPVQPGTASQGHAGAPDRLGSSDPARPAATRSELFNWTAHKLALYLKLPVHAVTILRHLWALRWRWRRPVPRVASPDPRYRAKSPVFEALTLPSPPRPDPPLLCR